MFQYNFIIHLYLIHVTRVFRISESTSSQPSNTTTDEPPEEEELLGEYYNECPKLIPC